MATLCRAYTSEQHAHAAVERLLSAGIAGTAVQVLMGETAHDAQSPNKIFIGRTSALTISVSLIAESAIGSAIACITAASCRPEMFGVTRLVVL